MTDPCAYMTRIHLAGDLGEDTLFRGQPQRAMVNRARKVYGDYGQIVGLCVTVSLPADLQPVAGESITLQKTADTWLLDVLDHEKTDEHLHVWIVRPA